MTINKHNHVILQWVTTKGDGLGSYAKCEMLVPVTYNGHAYLYQICSFVDNSSAITLGREVLGLPHKFGHPSLSLSADTLAGKLQYSGFDVAVGTMNYDEEIMELADAYQFLQTPMLNLKMIPDVDGKPLISQLVSVSPTPLILLTRTAEICQRQCEVCLQRTRTFTFGASRKCSNS